MIGIDYAGWLSQDGIDAALGSGKVARVTLGLGNSRLRRVRVAGLLQSSCQE